MRWLSGRKRAGNTAVCLFRMHTSPLVKTQRRVLCKGCSVTSSCDSLSEWRLEWGVGKVSSGKELLQAAVRV